MPSQSATNSEVYLGEFLNNSATDSLVSVFKAASLLAEPSGTTVQLAHIILSLLEDSPVMERLTRNIGLSLRAELARQLFELPKNARSPGSLGFNLAALVEPARQLAAALAAPRVSPLIFLATCLSADVSLDPSSSRTLEVIRAAGVTAELLGARVPDADIRQDFTYKSLGFGTDLTAMARAGVWVASPLIGMEKELVTLVKLLGTGSACVVGEPGVGKTAFIEGFAWRVGTKDRTLLSPRMHSCTIVMIQSAEILQGTSAQGQLEQRIQQMVSFFARNPNVIPFFDEVHRLLDADDPASRTISAALKGPMARGLFRCVGCTTDKEYARYIANDEAMASRLRRFLLPEPDRQTAIQIIAGSKPNLLRGPAAELGIDISDEAVTTAVRITSTYQRSDRLPRKAFHLLNSAITEKVYEVEMSHDIPPSKVIEAADVARVFSEISGIPVDALDPNRPAYYNRLREQLALRVVGQEQSIRDVVSHLALQTRGWVNPKRPRGRFLFLGPPGVGKTELATSVAAEVMRDHGSMIVLNMAEYQDESSVKKFMGADPGYIGFGQTATLYSRVMMRPFSVVVLDEFEKSHFSLANPMLSILDGSADDSQGRHVDFSQCIFFLTSNALVGKNSSEARELWNRLTEIDNLEDDHERSRLLNPIDAELRSLLGALGGIWTPPLLDRLDKVCLFRPLAESSLQNILANSIVSLRAQSEGTLPASIDDPEVRAKIIADAMVSEGLASARRLERSLLRWLSFNSAPIAPENMI